MLISRSIISDQQLSIARLIVHSLQVDVDRLSVEAALTACGESASVLAPGVSASGDASYIDASGWSFFFDMADGHAVTPLIADRWRTLGVLDRVPIDVRERLLKAYRDNAERSAHIRREVIEYWQAIAGAGIPAILLKGWPLVEALHESPALRLINDVDLLVPADRAHDGLAALERAGLEPLPHNRDAWFAKHLPAYWRLNGRPVTRPPANMYDPMHPRPVELHVQVWERNFRGLGLRDPAGFWERSRVVNVAGCPMRIPSSEDALIHLCVHWACHWIEREARLNQLVDLDRFMRKFGDQVDWQVILATSDAARATRFVDAALSVARNLLGTPSPPAPVRDRLRAGCPPKLREWIDRRAADDVALMDYRHPDKGAAYVLTWLCAQTIRERLGMVRYALLPPREFIIGRYGLKRRWLAIPFYVPYVLSRTFSYAWPFARALTRIADFGMRNAE
ncbi:MAG: nucleotidyltransferase domain-containing protein [Anaerolineae bacterium]